MRFRPGTGFSTQSVVCAHFAAQVTEEVTAALSCAPPHLTALSGSDLTACVTKVLSWV